MQPKPGSQDEKAPVEPPAPPGQPSDSESSLETASVVPAPEPPAETSNNSTAANGRISKGGSDIPDGGLNAWLQVLGSFVVLFNTWGLINTFGVYQTWYEENLEGPSSSDISWVGSLQGGLLMLSGLISGPLYDMGYLRHMLWVGNFLIVFGQFMTSLATKYWQIVLAQGVCIGIGCGLSFLPATGVVSQYFKRKKSIALGLASAGSPTAGILFPVIFTKVEDKIGFAWGTRVLGFTLLALSVIPLTAMHTRIPPSKGRRSLVDVEAFKDWPFMAYLASQMFIFLGLYVAFFYIQLYGQSHNLVGHGGVDTPSTSFDSSYLVTLLNAGSVVGRILPNYLADHFGALNAFCVSALGAAVCAFAWIGIQSLKPLCAFAVLYGMFSGGILALMPSVIVSLSPHLSLVGVRMGMVFAASGVAILVGTPIAGAIVGGFSESEWDAMIGYSGAALAVGTVFCVASRLLVSREGRASSWRF
ncbi:MFS monocarboxylate [Zalerion maritima]|uniref:MFS monocarboxylate n=1 Tax=Zalerion maritima TaxID=339359 RepID=A0AAD5WMR1_9PEZI|nr:MFS monocarboxylate [Zalerion maritima]